ncbi:hypothetical protein KC328_g61 [Hortaea werneckii]|nr:hypothetical protein KC328_g61 [Hortaea werneckii]
MAGPDMINLGSPVAGDGDLSDDQIDQLLARATERMQQAGAAVKGDEKNPYTFPKLNAGELEKPYIASKGAVASVDSSRLLDDKDRKQANSIRKVEDPLTAKKAAIEEIIPIIFLERSSGTVLVAFLHQSLFVYHGLELTYHSEAEGDCRRRLVQSPSHRSHA